MNYKITVIFIIGLSPIINASFFGLFSSRQTTPKSDVVVGESQGSETDSLAYENYLGSLAGAYTVPYTSTQYVPVYVIPQQYTKYVQPQLSYIYHTHAAQHIPYKFDAAPLVTYPKTDDKFQRPITVLPSSSYHEASANIPEVTKSLEKLIKAPSTSTISRTKTIEFDIPKPQMPMSLYDLPVSGIAPDFRTGGYVAKTMTVSSSDRKMRSGRQFGHTYTNGDGTKVSEEGHLVHYGNGQETVVKRGQYEYIDTIGKPVLVKWVADDNGFRIIN